MSGKVKTLYGVYKALGRDAFLDAAKDYSCHVRGTVEATLREMETQWYDASHTATEADKMMDAYRQGLIQPTSQIPNDLQSINLNLKM